MTLAEKLRSLRHLEGQLRDLGRPLSQSELARAIADELGERVSQSYLSLIESGMRQHLSQRTRETLARFFKVHPGYLVSDPPGFKAELSPELEALEAPIDRWLADGAARFADDPALVTALERIAERGDTRRCLLLLAEIVSLPGLVEQLSSTLVPREERV